MSIVPQGGSSTSVQSELYHFNTYVYINTWDRILIGYSEKSDKIGIWDIEQYKQVYIQSNGVSRGSDQTRYFDIILIRYQHVLFTCRFILKNIIIAIRGILRGWGLRYEKSQLYCFSEYHELTQSTIQCFWDL